MRELVARGQLRFFLLGPPGGGLAGLFDRARAGQALTITNWVRNACEKLPGNATVGELYRCGRELPMPL